MRPEDIEQLLAELVTGAAAFLALTCTDFIALLSDSWVPENFILTGKEPGKVG